MKKIIVLFFVGLSALLMSGCSKELKTLDGTVWEKTDSDVVTTLTFTDVKCELKIASTINPSYYSYAYYSYEYSSSSVMMYPESDENATLKGIISGNTMSVVNMSNEKTIGIFTKR
ncbi:MAG: hypothetical protein NC115_12735 [Bacteroidales bacterium]|nr:hypothetical protein [Bacteroides sp.]MCM1199307.1 hypothetical protein [Clostridium sp.]MCM1503509.1 hypothetical protein [Bacteroidales bacterium]